MTENEKKIVLPALQDAFKQYCKNHNPQEVTEKCPLCDGKIEVIAYECGTAWGVFCPNGCWKETLYGI